MNSWSLGLESTEFSFLDTLSIDFLTFKNFPWQIFVSIPHTFKLENNVIQSVSPYIAGNWVYFLHSTWADFLNFTALSNHTEHERQPIEHLYNFLNAKPNQYIDLNHWDFLLINNYTTDMTLHTIKEYVRVIVFLFQTNKLN